MGLIRLNKGWRKFRDWLFHPIVKSLDGLGVSASSITNLRLLLVALFLGSFYYSPIWSIIIFTFELLLDMIDGPLARFANQNSDRGHFMDVLIDSVAYAALVFTFLYYSVNPIAIAVNLIFVNYVFLLAAIKKNEMNKTDWIINPYPRSAYLWYPAMAAFYAFHLSGLDYMELSLWVSNFASFFLFFYYYITIQTRWARKYRQ